MPKEPEQPPPPPTVHLVERAQAGESAALDELVERYYPRIWRIVRIRVGGRVRWSSSLDDVVQGVMLRVIQGVERFEARSDSQFIHWVARLAHNEICDQGRQGQRRPDPTDEVSRVVAREARSLLSRYADDEEQRQVDECLAGLEPMHREVLLLRDYEGASWEEIHASLDRPSVGACQQLHQRAKEKLKQALARRRSRP